MITILELLGKNGALDGFGMRRDVLWRLGELRGQYAEPGRGAALLETSPDLPDLAWLSPLELSAWDVATTEASTGTHAMAFHRAALEHAGCWMSPISTAEAAFDAVIDINARKTVANSHRTLLHC